ncbi:MULTISPECIES: SCO family protein [unclassified Variovorax]|uniref:SCO family protein n=1 Tax=unclassified Variovorax TaxID=663243 RepID=UPI001BD6C38C|nr:MULTISPECIES: SCO family protein [unclassified Variovorax]
MKRRAILRASMAALPALCFGTARAHNAAGEVRPPLPAPDIQVTSNGGSKSQLRDLLAGRATALQLMFTGCSSVCPIQGALFAQVQAALPRGDAPLQLLSASIDPLGDDPRALTAWLGRFGAGPRWSAFSPAPASLDRWLDFLAGRSVGPDKHTAQVYFFDRQARLVLRTVDFPRPAEVARLLAQLVALK